MTTPLTREQYEDRKRRLEADIEDAGKAIVAARAHYDAICDDLRDLRTAWDKQRHADGTP